MLLAILKNLLIKTKKINFIVKANAKITSRDFRIETVVVFSGRDTITRLNRAFSVAPFSMR